MVKAQRPIERLRSRFDEIYDLQVVGGGFFETDAYYRADKERYWRSLELLCHLDLPNPAKVLEIGGGQLALLCKLLFNDDCTVADITRQYIAPLQKVGIRHVTLNLMDAEAADGIEDRFDIIVLLEVIEHIPLPAYLVIERIKPLLKPGGLLFLTTPNLFRLRNLIRMALGVEFLDRFMIPEPGHGLGHQLEYSAEHLQWQLKRAGMEVVMLTHDSLGRTGHSLKARLGRRMLAPFDLRPKWRDGLVAAARPALGHNRE
jgi:2-polyprenyl-3-methyl-5-hydroxy-6-metoxy-1,4-benzoquinol methylase